MLSPPISPLAAGHLPDAGCRKSIVLAYFPSKFADPETTRKYQCQSFFTDTESASYLEQAKDVWLSKASAAFPSLPSLTVEGVVGQLRHTLQARANELHNIEGSWQALTNACQALVAVWGDDPDAGITDAQQDVQKLKAKSAQQKALENSFREYLAKESLW